ncbi:MAG: hypothetical protein ACRD9Q_01785 [Nitrososphaeraceae archaeon]
MESPINFTRGIKAIAVITNKVTYPTCNSSRITAIGVKIRSTYTAYDFKNFDIFINHVVEILYAISIFTNREHLKLNLILDIHWRKIAVAIDMVKIAWTIFNSNEQIWHLHG